MKSKTIFKKDNKNVKKPKHLKILVFLLYAPKNIKIGPMQYEIDGTEVVVSLPENSKRKCRTYEIEGISCGEQRLWIGILNKSLTKNIDIKKKSVLGLFVLETKGRIEIKYEKQTKKKQASSKISKKNPKRCLPEQA